MSGITTVKQDNFINSDKVSKLKVKIFGLGSIGSIMAKQLALVGVKDITGYDFDIVEAENIGSQLFDQRHIGMKKTEAIQKILKENYDYDITVIDGKVDKKTIILPEENTIYFCAFDSLEARQMVWDKVKDFPIIWGESRIGRSAQRYYFVDLRNPEKEWVEEYTKSLDPEGPRTELKCGEKGCYPSNAELVGKIIKQFINVAEGKPLVKQYIGDWGMPPAIFIAPKEIVPKEIKYGEI